MSFKFEMLKEQSSIIKVIGVGGGGGNAVNHMYKQGISGVDFIICNTDAQALETSPIPNKVQLGASLTEGMGAGADPSVGENSAIESIEDIKRMLGTNTKMLFITAGMGGGTGTGASPVLAKAARELGILTVAIVTTPFAFEGKRRKMQAEEGLAELQKYVDSYLVISNDRLREIFGNLTMTAAFAKADDILTTAAKGIAEIITIPGYVNVDFKDVNTVMSSSGVCIMGNYVASGEDRAFEAVQGALASPLLKDNEIEGARYILLNITSGTQEVTMDEVSIITDYIQDKAGMTADLIWGNCIDPNMGEELSVTIIATGFQTSDERIKDLENQKVEIPLIDNKVEAPYIRPVNQFVDNTPVQAQNPTDSNMGQSPIAPTVAPTNNPVQQIADLNPTSGGAQAPQPQVRPQQVDLFSFGTQPTENKNPQQDGGLKNETPKDDGIIRFTLTEEDVEEEESVEEDLDGMYQIKTTPSIFHFETPKSIQDLEGSNTPTTSYYPEQEAYSNNPFSDLPEEDYTSNQPSQHATYQTNSYQEPVNSQNTQRERIEEIPSTPFEIENVEDETYKTDDYMENQLSKTKDRIMRLKELSMKLRTSNGLHEIESEPAYKRKNMNLDQVAHSSESQVSRFTLSVDEGVTHIKPNNSFLHDNVD